MPVAIVVLFVVFILIAIRRVGRFRIRIWQAMTGGAIAVLLTGAIGIGSALRAIDPDVMFFLLGLFVVGAGLEESGYLAHVSYRFFKRARTRDALLLMVLFGGGFASALLMNDTLAIIGTPVMLLLARKHEMSPRLLLLGLAIAVTTGSVFSPIGNPQNLLIALNGSLDSPFVTFFRYLFVPTLICLLLAFLVLRRFFPDDFHSAELRHSQEPIRDRQTARLSRVSLAILVSLILLKVAASVVGSSADFRLTYIALVSASPFVFARQRKDLIRRIDWATLLFFLSMFVLMQAVWQTGYFQTLILRDELPADSIVVILGVGVGLSQLISNVPLVALYQPVLSGFGAGELEMMALAAGSTIAGNLLILGAASNIIIIQSAEEKSGESLTFWDFARVGLPLTALQVIVYWVYLEMLA